MKLSYLKMCYYKKLSTKSIRLLITSYYKEKYSDSVLN